MHNKNIEKKDLKFFGIIFSVIFFSIFGYLFFFKNSLNLYFIYLGFLFLIPSLIYPFVLIPFYKIWMKFGSIVGFINTKIIIGFLFFCVFYPIGIIGKVFGKNFLDKKISKNRETYFEKIPHEKNNFDEQF